MLETLKFVRGAVSSKELVPVLTHFLIDGGRLQGSNGSITLDAPCPELAGYSAVVHADRFLRAVDACEGEPTITVDVEKAVVRVSRKRFRATLPLLPPDTYPRASLAAHAALHTQSIGKAFVHAIERVLPYMSTDASRPWSCSIRVCPGVDGGRARIVSTANVILARTWLDFDWSGPELILPAAAVHELIRIEKEPVAIRWDDNAIEVTYADGTWFQSRQITGGWPDTSKIESRIDDETEWFAMPFEFSSTLRKLRPFVADPKMPIIKTSPEGLSTVEGQHSAQVDCDPLPVAAFRFETLALVAVDASHWAPHRYPAPVPFKGHGIEGVLSGVVI